MRCVSSGPTTAAADDPAKDFMFQQVSAPAETFDATVQRHVQRGGRSWPRLAEHCAEMFAANPIPYGLFALQTDTIEHLNTPLQCGSTRRKRTLMDGHTVQQHARDRAQQLPQAEVSYPFGPDHEVYKVRGKVFMLLTEVTGEPIVTLKATPTDATTLRQAFAEITPGYHMNKRHWITLSPGAGLDQQLIEDLVTESYLLVIEHNLPKYLWPVNPATFGQPLETADQSDDEPANTSTCT